MLNKDKYLNQEILLYVCIIKVYLSALKPRPHQFIDFFFFYWVCKKIKTKLNYIYFTSTDDDDIPLSSAKNEGSNDKMSISKSYDEIVTNHNIVVLIFLQLL